jgi:MATE family multidrug resistance protein
MHRVRIVAFAMISANLVNFCGNWVLIYGHFGMPALGATGSGLATSISRFYLMLVLLGYLVWRGRRQHWPLLLHAGELHWQRIRQIVKLGVPAATQIALEVGAFSASTLLAGRLGAVVVSAHQIALLMASLTFMVPLGIGQATSVRVGHAIGQRNGLGAAVSAWSGVTLSACFMSCMAVVLWTVPMAIVHIFTNDAEVGALAVRLLAIAAFFQFFDGVQVTSICALRGSGNTRIAMVTDAIGWWIVGLPMGAFLCFGLGWGVRGLWLGLCVGLVSIACVLAFALRRRMIRLQQELPATSLA